MARKRSIYCFNFAGGGVLELACGDGFNARNFYSLKSKNIIACDFDKSAIATAHRKNTAPNIKFIVADIRYQMPEGIFDNIVLDAAIEHFTADEIHSICSGIKSRLAVDGIFSGYTIVEGLDGKKHLEQHETEFHDKEHLMSFLRPYFQNVLVFETKYPDRHNLYFWCSDGVLPFSNKWQGMIVHSQN